MPAEAPVTTPEAVPAETPALSFNADEVFKSVFPGEEGATEPAVTPPPPPKPEPVPEVPKAPVEPEPTPEAEPIPESVFGDTPIVETTIPEEVTKLPEEVKSKKGQERWHELTKRGKDALERALKAEQKIIELEAKRGETPAEAQARIEQAEGRAAELSSIIERLDVTQHPQFRAQFELPRQHMMATAKGLLESVGAESNAFEKAMALSGKSRIDAIDALTDGIESRTVQNSVANLVANIDQLDQAREGVLANAHNLAAQRRQQDQANMHRQMEATEQQMLSMVDNSAEYLASQQGFEVLRESKEPGFEAWNKQREGIISTARELMTKTTDPAQIAGASVLAAAAPIYRRLAHDYRKRALAAEKTLQDQRDSEPTLAGTGKDAPGADAPVEGECWEDAVVRRSAIRG